MLIKTRFELTGNKSPEGALIPMFLFCLQIDGLINGGEKLLGGEGELINDSLRYFKFERHCLKFRRQGLTNVIG